MCNDGPDFFRKPVVIDLEVGDARLLVELRTAAAEIVASVALATKVHPARVDDQGTI